MAGRLHYPLIGLALAAMLALGGCAGKDQEAMRRLNTGEAEKLVRMHSARTQALDNQERQDHEKPDLAELESSGDDLVLRGELNAAAFQYQRALTLTEGEKRNALLLKAAVVNLKMGAFPQSQDLFMLLTQAQPGSGAAWEGLGLSRLALSDLAGAREALEKAVSLSPHLWRSHNALGVVYNRMEQPDLALASFRRALQEGPPLAAVYNNVGMAFQKKGDPVQAEANFRQALTLDNNNKLASNNLGLLLARQGRENEALTVFQKSVGLAQAHNNLGCVLTWMGRKEEASAHFKKALESMPRYYPLAARHLEALGGSVAGMPGGGLGGLYLTPPENRPDPVKPEAPAQPGEPAAGAIPPAPAAAAPLARTAPMAPTPAVSLKEAPLNSLRESSAVRDLIPQARMEKPDVPASYAAPSANSRREPAPSLPAPSRMEAPAALPALSQAPAAEAPVAAAAPRGAVKPAPKAGPKVEPKAGPKAEPKVEPLTINLAQAAADLAKGHSARPAAPKAVKAEAPALPPVIRTAPVPAAAPRAVTAKAPETPPAPPTAPAASAPAPAPEESRSLLGNSAGSLLEEDSWRKEVPKKASSLVSRFSRAASTVQASAGQMVRMPMPSLGLR